MFIGNSWIYHVTNVLYDTQERLFYLPHTVKHMSIVRLTLVVTFYIISFFSGSIFPEQ